MPFKACFNETRLMSINTRYFDRRTTDRYLEKGAIKEKELESYMKNLPDETNNAQWVQMDLHDAELGENDSGEDAEESGEEGA